MYISCIGFVCIIHWTECWVFLFMVCLWLLLVLQNQFASAVFVFLYAVNILTCIPRLHPNASPSHSLTLPIPISKYSPLSIPATKNLFCLYLLLLSHHNGLLLTNPRASTGIFSLVLEPVFWLLIWFVIIVRTQTHFLCPASLFSSEFILSFFRLIFGLLSVQLCTERTFSLSLGKGCSDCCVFKNLQMLVFQKPIVKWNLGWFSQGWQKACF